MGFECFGPTIEHAAIQEIVDKDKKIRFLEYDEK